MSDPNASQTPENIETTPSIFKDVALHQKKQAVTQYLVAVLISFCIFIPFFFFTQPVRVGDGSEYYAMGVSWAETHRPYMTESGWAHYNLLYQSNAIPGIESPQQLRSFAPYLVSSGGQDFNHFWFYSLAAAFIAELGDYSGLTISLHAAFLVLHFLLLAALFSNAVYFYQWQGLLTALVLTLLSPVFWYLDKVHTEFFTFAVTSIAVIFFLKRRYFASALCLALAATQNISFLLISLFVLMVGVVQNGKGKWNASSILLIGGSLLLNALHPLYYLTRYGVPSPQFLSGSAQAGLYLSRFWIWLLDPDVGLLPNWWFGCLVLLIALFITAKRKWRFDYLRPWLGFLLVFLVVSLVAQSSTINLNSGASPGPSRYALWYLCLFFPALLLIIRTNRQKWWMRTGFSILVLLGGIYSAMNFLPVSGSTAHCQPSALSWWLQRNLPGLYDPPAEIFTERYGGACELIVSHKKAAIIGPDCRKIYLTGSNLSGDFLITGAAGCNLDFAKINSKVKNRIQSGEWPGGDGYFHLSTEDVVNAAFIPVVGVEYSFGLGSPLTQAIGVNYHQWGLLEDWGFWSVGKSAVLHLPCPADAEQAEPPVNIELELEPFVYNDHSAVNASIELDGKTGWSGTLSEPQVLRMALPDGTCSQINMVTMRILVNNPASRAELGISGDLRNLGVGLRRMRYLHQ